MYFAVQDLLRLTEDHIRAGSKLRTRGVGAANYIEGYYRKNWDIDVPVTEKESIHLPPGALPPEIEEFLGASQGSLKVSFEKHHSSVTVELSNPTLLRAIWAHIVPLPVWTTADHPFRCAIHISGDDTSPLHAKIGMVRQSSSASTILAATLLEIATSES